MPSKPARLARAAAVANAAMTCSIWSTDISTGGRAKIALRHDRRRQRSDPRHLRLTAGVAQLGEDYAAVSVHRIDDAGEWTDPLVAIKAELSRFILASPLYVNVAGDDQADATSRQCRIKGYERVGGTAVVGRHGLRGSGTD